MNIFRLTFLLAAAGLLAACAATSDVADTTPPLEQVPTHDDTHGWGANLQSAGRR